MHFNPDGKVWQFVNTCVRFSILNILFVLTLVPIVTIGPARAALYSTVFAYDDNDDIDLGREYLRRLRTEFLQSLAATAIFALIAAVLVFSATFWHSLDGLLTTAVFTLIVVLSILVAVTFEYYFPLQARFSNTFRQTLKNAAMLPWTSPASTLALAGIDAVAIVAFIYIKPLRLVFILLGFAWLAYAKSLIYKGLFYKSQSRRPVEM